MDEQLQKQLADFVGSGLTHVCDAKVLAALAAAIGSALMHVDEAVGEVAAHQHGAIALGQLHALGLRRGAIQTRVRTGRLHRIYRGVYLVGNPLPAQFALDLGAVLACGENSHLSHASLLAACGVIDRLPPERHVTVVGRCARLKGVAAHEVPALHPADTWVFHGVPAVTPSRALLEIAATHDPATVADAVERAQVKRLVTADTLKATVQRAPRRAGTRAIGDILSMPAFTRSRAERLVLELCRKAGLPLPETNARIDGDEVDFLWRAAGVTLEFDSYAFHATRAAFERDRRRDADRQRAGITQLRTTWWELNHRPYELVARIAEALARAASVR